MKIHFISFVLVVVTFISCTKKDKEMLTDPPKEKKWMVTTVAGNGTGNFEDGPASMAEFKAPQDVAITSDGSIYVADAINHRIRKISNDFVISYAGSGTEDTIGGSGTAAGFAFPVQLTTDTTGNLYTLEIDDYRIRKISPAALVTVIAGTGIRGFADGRADTAKFGESVGIATDDYGNIYVSDNENKRIRKISSTGWVTTIAGTGRAGYVNGNADQAQFFSPTGIVIDKSGNLFVADYNHIRKITPDGIVSTYAGNDAEGYEDGKANVARFKFINDMVIDNAGNIYVSDDNRIREINIHGDVSTIAGSTAGYNDGDGASAKFNNPNGLGIDNEGNIYIADDNNNRIRKLGFQ
jgi:hypothetical protein